MGKVNNIQILRGVAALCVVYFHTYFVFWNFRPFGRFGVHIFFAISGFIMAYICTSDSSEFFTRRLIRIVPPYWAMTILLFLAAIAFPNWMKTTTSNGIQLVKSLLFIPYTKSHNLMQPLLFLGWTLNYEMVFYAIIAVGLLLFRRFSPVGTVLLLAAFMGVWYSLRRFTDIGIFYSSPIMITFALGIGVYYLYRAASVAFCRSVRPVALTIAPISFVLLILVEGLQPRRYAGLEVTEFMLCSCLLLISLTFLSKGGLDFGSKTLVLIGDASYVLYLIHPYIEESLNRVLSHRVQWLSSKSVPGMMVCIAASTLIAVAMHLWLERPGIRLLSARFLPDRRAAKRQALEAKGSRS